MKILVDINHPAHVHFFKNIIKELQDKGHTVYVTASLKDIAFELLDELKLDYFNLGTYGKTPLVKMLNVPIMAVKMFFVMLKLNPDIAMGIGSSRIAHAGILLGKKTLVFTDTEHAREQIALHKPFATYILTPDCFTTDLGKKQVRYNGYHELAYLHPNYFKPNPDVLKQVGLNPSDKFFILRFVSWNASHDIGQKGLALDEKIDLVSFLTKYGKVLISSEGKLPPELEGYKFSVNPLQMHDFLYYCTIYIGEGGTMASEAAVLGTPAIFVSTLTMGYIYEQEHRYGLLKRVEYSKDLIPAVKVLLDQNNLKQVWREKSQAMLKDKCDVTNWVVDFLEEVHKINSASPKHA